MFRIYFISTLTFFFSLACLYSMYYLSFLLVSSKLVNKLKSLDLENLSCDPEYFSSYSLFFTSQVLGKNNTLISQLPCLLFLFLVTATKFLILLLYQTALLKATLIWLSLIYFDSCFNTINLSLKHLFSWFL